MAVSNTTVTHADLVTYRTQQGDRLDLIALRRYGEQAVDALEWVMDSNPELRGMPIYLPMGLIIKLPDLPVRRVSQSVNPWR